MHGDQVQKHKKGDARAHALPDLLPARATAKAVRKLRAMVGLSPRTCRSPPACEGPVDDEWPDSRQLVQARQW
jgi:hypothetical protein